MAHQEIRTVLVIALILLSVTNKPVWSYGENCTSDDDCQIPNEECRSGSPTNVCLCDSGFKLSGSVCIAIDCGDPPAQTHSIQTGNTGTGYLDNTYYTCIPGYMFRNGVTTYSIRCYSSGWSAATGCIKVCPDGWYGGGTVGNCFYVGLESEITWFDAQGRCVSMGANLASITTEEDQAYIESNITEWAVATSDVSSLWIGGYDRLNSTFGEEGVWRYIDGSQWEPDIIRWDEGEPNSSNEGCVQIYTDTTKAGLLNDAPCDMRNQRTLGYLCKKTVGCGDPPAPAHSIQTGNTGTGYSDITYYTCIPGYALQYGDTTYSIRCYSSGWSAVKECIKVCPDGWYGGGTLGNCFYVGLESEITWFDAQGRCVSMGANLASITTEEDQAYIESNITEWAVATSDVSSLWIGGYDRLNSTFGEEGVWRYIDESQWEPDIIRWDEGEPNGSHEGCVQIYTETTKAGLLNDFPCDLSHERTLGYLCKKTVVCDTPACPENSYLDLAQFGTTIGSRARCTCDTGYSYYRSYSLVMTCQSYGTWNVDVSRQSCYKDCGKNPVSPAYGTLTSITGTRHNDRAYYMCYAGYRLPDGAISMNIRCQSTGEWEPLPECIKVCPDGWYDGGTLGNCFYVGLEPEITWFDAQDRCVSMGANLASITTEEDQTYIESKITEYTEATGISNSLWIGGYDKVNSTFGEEGVWRYIDGFQWQPDIIQWQPGQPDNANDEGCVHILMSPLYAGQLNDLSCLGTAAISGYLCKMTINTFQIKFTHERNRVTRIESSGVMLYRCCLNIHDSQQSNKVLVDFSFCTDCGSSTLTNPSNGRVNVYRFAAVYSCDTGYILVGSDTRTCLYNGTWSSTTPTCGIAEPSVGGNCDEVRICGTNGAKCIDNVCTCQTGVYNREADSCDTMELFSFGEEIGDAYFTNVDDECSEGVALSDVPIPVFNMFHKKVFVCANGLVSFDQTYTNPEPENMAFDVEKRTLIGPFHFDANVTNPARVFYRRVNISSDDAKLAGQLISKVHGLTSFSMASMLLVTWYDVQNFDRKEEGHQTCTFQLALVTDGSDTFALYVYGHERMKCVSHSEKTNVWIGYTADGRFKKTNALSFQTQVFDIDKHIESKGVKGLWSYRLTQVGLRQPNDIALCLAWFNDYKQREAEINDIFRIMPDCPCSLQRLKSDIWFLNGETFLTNINTICVTIVPVNIYRPHGKTCCYDKPSGLWIRDYPRAGGYLDYHPFFDPEKFQTIENASKSHCCEKSDMCHLYTQLHPIGNCYRETWFQFGLLWGDPHVRTLDGLTFIFNGLGEYTMVEIKTDEENFTLQARTERPLKSDNKSLSFATVFSAFAAKDHSGASLHVELNNAKTGINLYANGIDLSNQFNKSRTEDTPFSHRSDEGNLIISRSNNSLVAFFPSTEIGLEVTDGVRMLTMKAIIHNKFRGQTAGLLGNFDGESSNDFILPNGTILPTSISEKEIFHYGSLWSIETPVFVYPNGTNHLDFANSSFIPKFLDDVDNENVSFAISLCGSEANLPCIFDFIFTEDEEVAENTKLTNETAVQNQNEIGNVNPTIQGCETMEVQLNKEVTCHVTLTDDDNTNLDIVFLQNTANATKRLLKATEGTITYLPISTDPVQLSISVRDSQGVLAPAIQVKLVMCTGCSDHGECSDEEIGETYLDNGFKYKKCVCQPYYEGRDCELDFDGCAASPCSNGRTCTDLNVTEHQRIGKAFTCSPCDELGHFVEHGDKCIDIDECETGMNKCQQICENIDGSYLCSCNAGYRKETAENCSDINECDEATDNCQQICENTEGSFKCSCYDGFTLNSTTNLCEQVENPCDGQEINCSQTNGCSIISGKPTCVCSKGFELSEEGDMCTDMDECEQNVCSQGCVNYIGGFNCTCVSGYQLSRNDPTICEVCEYPFWGENCQEECECTGQGAIRCDTLRGCVCDDSWTGLKCDLDVDECEMDNNICGDPYKQCINTEGSYYCECMKGFHRADPNNNSPDCDDIDECSSADLNDCSQTCINSFGGYSCGCEAGFLLHNHTECIDIDECEENLSGCEHVCDNKHGFFNCYCSFGFEINDDRRTCTKVEDLCYSFSNLTCQQRCKITDNSASCECNIGYRLGVDQQSCIDINECDEIISPCDHEELCTNLNGSFTCGCRIGWRLQNDKRTCTECDSFHYGVNCDLSCNCGIGSERCDPVSGCICKEGWTGQHCDVDKDECSATESPCDDRNSDCFNFPGSYSCRCKMGYYKGDSLSCQDIDECANATSNTCDQYCTNTEGSYICSCRNGFRLVNNACEDIDECSGPNECDSVCQNTVGGYRCSCPGGFKLDLRNRRKCVAVSECDSDMTAICLSQNAFCYKEGNHSKCQCQKGFTDDSEDQIGNCTDIKECDAPVQPCSHDCVEEEGGFHCECINGSKLDVDGRTCIGCSNWTFGYNCAEKCSCDIQNTRLCNATDGTCTCLDGWFGSQCTNDVNECGSDAHGCPEFSECENTLGSYGCKCSVGYVKVSDGTCQSCDRLHYGANCQKVCPCNATNTNTCDSVDGTCTCLQGWGGANCTEDANECEDGANPCDNQKPNCVNLPGSYKCVCEQGYREVGGSCDDIDECIETQTNCSYECVNLPGAFRCICNTGYQGDGFVCQECSGSTHGRNCSESCNCISENAEDKSQTCDPASGRCQCKQGWVGDRCHVDIDECEDENICKDSPMTGCHNMDGSYLCDCYRGYNRQNSTGNCTVTGTQEPAREPPSDNEEIIQMELVTNLVLKNTVNLNVAATYQAVKTHSEEMLQAAFNMDVFVTDLSLGSLVINFNMITKKDEKTRATLSTKLVDVAAGRINLTYSGQVVSASGFFFGNYEVTRHTTPCHVFLQLNGPCASGYSCPDNAATPTCRRDDKVSLTLIIGLSAGGGSLVLLLIVSTVCIRILRTRNEKQNSSQRNRSRTGLSDFEPIRSERETTLSIPTQQSSDSQMKAVAEKE